MTVSSQTSRIEQLGDGATVAFTVNYYFLGNGDLQVYLDDVLQTITTNYTVSGAGNPSGGTVTFTSAPANGVKVIILNRPAITQGLDYIDNDPFPAESHERGLDKLTIIAQSLQEQIDRTVQLPVDSDETGIQFTESIFQARDDAQAAAIAAEASADRIDLGALDQAIADAEAAELGAQTAQSLAEDARDAAQLAETNAKLAETNAEAAQTAAEFAQSEAEAARDAAFVNADVYADTVAGLAGTVNGEQFQVVDGDEIIRYLNNAGVADEVARYPSASRFPTSGVDSLFGLVDSGNENVSLTDKSGNTYIPLLDESLQETLSALNQSALDALARDQFTAEISRDENQVISDVFNFLGESEATRAFAPTIVRTGKNTAFAVCERRGFDGTAGDDRGKKKVFGRTITFDRVTRGVTLGAIVNIAGEIPTGTLGPYNASVAYVESGTNAGRIYCFYSILTMDEMTEELTDFDPKVRYSDDGGATFSAEEDMSVWFASIPATRGYLIGPGHGIQLSTGRIVVPAYQANAEGAARAFLFYSDDGGTTWDVGPFYPIIASNESSLVDLKNGELLWIVRTLNVGKRYARLDYDLNIFDAQVYLNSNNASMFGETIAIQTGAIQAENIFDKSTRKILVSMPSATPESVGVRKDMKLWASYDGGYSFPYSVTINPGRFAEYSDITLFGPNDIAVLYSDGAPEGTFSNVIRLSITSLSSFLGE